MTPTLKVQIATTLPTQDIPEGMVKLIAEPGWAIDNVHDPELVIHNQSEVMLKFSKTVGFVELTLHVNDYTTLLTRVFVYRLIDSNWNRYGGCRYEIILPPQPNSVLDRLKTAKLPVVFIDVEAKAQSSNSLMTSVGAVCGDLATGEVFTWFQTELPALYQQHRDVELATCKWWLQVYSEIPLLRDLETLRTESLPSDVAEAILQLNRWFDQLGEFKREVEVFANGPEYDAANLDSLYRQLDSQLPWKFRRNQSVRTMVLMGRKLLGIDPKYKERPGLVEHFALHDALREFQYSSEIYRVLELKCGPIIVVDAAQNVEVVNAGNAGESVA